MNRALITGCDGQDGRFLSQLLLKQGFEVYGISRPVPSHKIYENRGIHRLAIDLTKKSEIHKAIQLVRPSVIFHLASVNPASSNATLFLDRTSIEYSQAVQVEATKVFLNAISDIAVPCKFILAGSSRMYSGLKKNTVITVDTIMDPADIYGEHKASAREIVTQAQNDGLAVGTAILFNHESSLRKPEFLFPHLASEIAKVLRKEKPAISVRDAMSGADWHAAVDTVQGLLKMANYPNLNEDFIFASGKYLTVQEIVSLYFQEYSQQSPPMITSTNRNTNSFSLTGEIARTVIQLDWTPKVQVTSILDELVKSS